MKKKRSSRDDQGVFIIRVYIPNVIRNFIGLHCTGNNTYSGQGKSFISNYESSGDFPHGL